MYSKFWITPIVGIAALMAIILVVGNNEEIKASIETAESTVLLTNSNNSPQATFLVIQHASSGSFTPLENETYSLTLSNVSKSIAFSDRPQRMVGTLDNQGFLDAWVTGSNSFAVDPPNAALVVIDDDNMTQEDIDVVELLNVATTNAELNEFQYTVRGLNATSLDIPSQLGEATLVIDPSFHPYLVANTKFVNPDISITEPGP